MRHVIGIDLGTTNSCLAVLEHRQATVLTNAEGGRTTPSVIAFMDDGERVVGEAARRQSAILPEATVSSIKRFMGRRMEEVEDEEDIVSYRLTSGENNAVRVVIGERLYAPEELSAMILAKLKSDSEAYLQAGGSSDDTMAAVITVPAYFNDAQRQATKQAAEIAGLEVLRLVNEPTAAALAYGFGQGRDERLLVFDLGGGTFDVSVLEIGDNVFEVLSTHGDNHLGGDNFDKVIVDWLVGEFQAEKGINLAEDKPALQRLYEAAEKAKIELSSMPKAQISLPFISASSEGPEHLKTELTRSKLTELCSGLLDRLVGPTQSALSEAAEKSGPINHVILVGGMTRMPAVQDKVKELTGKEPHQGVNPDEAVALGAAIQAGVLKGEVDDVLLLDVIPITLGIETKGGVMTELIRSNTTIPARQTETFTTAEDNQPSVEVNILQGERDMAADNRSLGRLQLLGIPSAQAGIPQIEVVFDVNSDGILKVSAQDLGTGNKQQTEIKAATGLSEEEVERLRNEALINRRKDTEARLEAEERVAGEVIRDQTARQLRESRPEMTDQERAALETGYEEMTRLLETEASLEEIRSAREALTDTLQSFSGRLYGQTLDIEQEDASTALPPKILSDAEPPEVGDVDTAQDLETVTDPAEEADQPPA